MCLRVFHQSNSILPQYTLLHHVLFPFIMYSNHIVQPHQKEFAQKQMGLTVNFPYNSPMFYLTQSHVNSSYNQSAFFHVFRTWRATTNWGALFEMLSFSLFQFFLKFTYLRLWCIFGESLLEIQQAFSELFLVKLGGILFWGQPTVDRLYWFSLW